MRSVLALILCALVIGGCASLEAPAQQPPAYTRTADHYRSFQSAAGLSAYLRAGSEAGPLVSAHRGGIDTGYPENALASFERSLRYGPALIECDVRVTQDGVAVLLHDETLDRTTSGSGPVRERSQATVRSLLLRDAYGVITPFRVPTLEEALAWSRGRAVLMLDVKEARYMETILDGILRHGAENRVVVITYTLMDALHVHGRAPEVMISVQADAATDLAVVLAGGIDPTRLVVFSGVGEVQPDIVELAHAHGIRVILGTFGQTDEIAQTAGPVAYQTLLERGIDILATDEVALALRAAREYQAFLVR